MAVDRIRAGGAQIIVAGGAESMSLIPMGGTNWRRIPGLWRTGPQIYMSMGLTAERVQRKYGITREDPDAFALRSHRMPSGRSSNATSTTRLFR